MAQVTIEIPAKTEPVYVGPIAHRVWLWRTPEQGGKTSGSWVEFEDLHNTGDIVLIEGQEYDTAEITHHYGPNRRPPQMLLQEFDPYDDEDELAIIRITIDQVENEGEPDEKVSNKPIFHGVIGSVEIDRQALTAIYKCYDLARWILEHIKFDRGIAEREQYYSGAFVELIGHKFNDNWPFNDGTCGPDDDATLTDGKIFESGNMSEAIYDPEPNETKDTGSPVWELQYPTTVDPEVGINIFGSKGGPGSAWTHRRILKMFIEAYINHGRIEDAAAATGFRSVLPEGFPLSFKIINADILDSALLPVDNDGDRAAKQSLATKIAKLDLREKSGREFCNTVIRGAGNLGWRPIVLDNDEDDSGHKIGIVIWDKTAKPSGNAVENTEIDGNSRATPISKVGMVVDVDSDGVEYDPKPRVEVDATAKANTIIVQSARREIGTTFTYDRRDSDGKRSFIPLWTAAAKAELDGLLTTTDTDKTAKNKLEDRRLESVYRAWGVPKRFNFEDWQTLLDAATYRPLCAKRVPVFDSASGRYIEVVQKNTITGKEIPVRIWNHPRRFMGKLFLRNGWVYGDGIGGGLMPPTSKTFSEGQPKGQGEEMSPLYWMANIDGSLAVYRDLNSGNPALWAVKGFNERSDALSFESKHRWANTTENTKSAHYDLTGRSKEIQKAPYGKSTLDVAPYDEIAGEIDDTKLRGMNYESWKALIASESLEVDDRMCLIIQNKKSIARGDPVSMIAIRMEEWKYKEAREMLAGQEDDQTPIVLGTDPDIPYIVQNDFDKLEAYARGLCNKFNKAKRIGTLTFDFFDSTFEPIGQWVGMCRKKDKAWIKIRVDAPVAKVTHNLQRQTTVVDTEEAVDVEPALIAYRILAQDRIIESERLGPPRSV